MYTALVIYIAARPTCTIEANTVDDDRQSIRCSANCSNTDMINITTSVLFPETIFSSVSETSGKSRWTTGIVNPSCMRLCNEPLVIVVARNPW